MIFVLEVAFPMILGKQSGVFFLSQLPTEISPVVVLPESSTAVCFFLCSTFPSREQFIKVYHIVFLCASRDLNQRYFYHLIQYDSMLIV